MSKRENIEDILDKISDSNLIEATENKLGNNNLSMDVKKHSNTKEIVFASLGIGAIAATAIITVNMHKSKPVDDKPDSPLATQTSEIEEIEKGLDYLPVRFTSYDDLADYEYRFEYDDRKNITGIYCEQFPQMSKRFTYDEQDRITSMIWQAGTDHEMLITTFSYPDEFTRVDYENTTGEKRINTFDKDHKRIEYTVYTDKDVVSEYYFVRDGMEARAVNNFDGNVSYYYDYAFEGMIDDTHETSYYVSWDETEEYDQSLTDSEMLELFKKHLEEQIGNVDEHEQERYYVYNKTYNEFDPTFNSKTCLCETYQYGEIDKPVHKDFIIIDEENNIEMHHTVYEAEYSDDGTVNIKVEAVHPETLEGYDFLELNLTNELGNVKLKKTQSMKNEVLEEEITFEERGGRQQIICHYSTKRGISDGTLRYIVLPTNGDLIDGISIVDRITYLEAIHSPDDIYTKIVDLANGNSFSLSLTGASLSEIGSEGKQVVISYVDDYTDETETQDITEGETEEIETEVIETEELEPETVEPEVEETTDIDTTDPWANIVIDPAYSSELNNKQLFAPVFAINLDNFSPSLVKHWSYDYMDGEDKRNMSMYYMHDEKGLFLGSNEMEGAQAYTSLKYDEQGRLISDGIGTFTYSEDGLSRTYTSMMAYDDVMNYIELYPDKKTKLTINYFDGALQHINAYADMILDTSSGTQSFIKAEAHGYNSNGELNMTITYKMHSGAETSEDKWEERHTIAEYSYVIPMPDKGVDACMEIGQELLETIWDHVDEATIVRRGISVGKLGDTTYRYDEYNAISGNIVESHLYTTEGATITDKYIKYDYEYSNGDKIVGIAQSINDIRIFENSFNCENADMVMYYNLNGRDDNNYIEVRYYHYDISFVSVFSGCDGDNVFNLEGEGFNAEFSAISMLEYDDHGRVIHAVNDDGSQSITIEYK